MTGTGLMMFLVPLGLGSVVLQHPLMLKALHWGGAAVLLSTSWKIATSSRIESAPRGNPVGFVGAAVFQWINPKSWLVSTSAAGTFLSAEGGSSPWAPRSSASSTARADCEHSTSRWGRCSRCRSF
jgi:threonine/homoserine/homoserine lactone efflux protein